MADQASESRLKELRKRLDNFTFNDVSDENRFMFIIAQCAMSIAESLDSIAFSLEVIATSGDDDKPIDVSKVTAALDVIEARDREREERRKGK